MRGVSQFGKPTHIRQRLGHEFQPKSHEIGSGLGNGRRELRSLPPTWYNRSLVQIT